MKIAPTNFTVRPFESTELDYAALAELMNQDWPNNPSTVEFWKQNDSTRKPKYMHRRYIGEIKTKNSKQIVAVGFVNNRGLLTEPGKYNIKFCIDKEFKDQGFDEPIYNQMITELADKDLVALKTEIPENHGPRVQLFQQKGFQQSKMPKRYAQLDISRFDFDHLAEYADKVAASGIKIVNVQNLKMEDANWMQKLYNLDTAIEKEFRSANEYKHMEFDAYVKMLEDPKFLSKGQLVAIDGDDYVGISSLWPDPVDEEILYVGTTKILLSHRRRGIATALKLKSIAFAQSYGAKAIQTRNEVNSPMHSLNLKLGFKPGIILLSLEKVIG